MMRSNLFDERELTEGDLREIVGGPVAATSAAPAPAPAPFVAPAPTQTATPFTPDKFKELLKQAGRELTPNYFLTTPTGQAEREGELPTYLPTQVGEDFQGSFYGNYGGIPVHRFAENELHINVPTPQGEMRYIFDKEGNFVNLVRVNPDRGIVTRMFPAVTTAVLTAMGIPAPIAAGVTSYGMTGDIEAALKSAGLSFVGQQVMPMVEKPINQLASTAVNLLPSTAPDVLTNLVSDAVAGGSKALVGQGISSLITGQQFDPTAAFLGGAVSESTKNLLSSNTELKQLPPAIRNSITNAVMAGVLGKDPTAAAINTFINQTLRSAGNTIRASQPPSTTGPAEFETRSIIDPMGDMGGTLVPGEAGEDYVDPNRVVVSGQSEPVDFLSLFDIDAASTGLSTTTPNRVVVPGAREAAETETPVMVRPTPAPKPGQSVPVIGTRESPSLGDQFLNDLLDQTVKPEQVTVTGTKLPKDDIADQSVSVTGTKIAAPAPSPAPAPAPSAPAPRAPAPAPQVTAARAPTPQQDMSYITELPLYQSVFYKEMKEKERREELARELEQQENADPYERLMDLAERNPEMAADELMKIVEGT
jgi:hypothetical protein